MTPRRIPGVASDPPKSSQRESRPFRLGDLEVHPASGEVRGRRGPERLRPLLVDILLRLAATPGEVVRRETLLEEVWPRRMVNDEVLSRAIAELRTALGDDARQSRYVETLPKIGYRLVAPVEWLDTLAETAAAAAAPPPAPTALRKSTPVRIVAALAAVAIVGAFIYFLRQPASISPAAISDLERRITAAQPFASDPELEVGPRFSPDGKRVIYSQGEGGKSRLVIRSVDGPEQRVVGESGWLQIAPVFFPDGRRIAYWQSRDNDCAIVEHDLETGTTRPIVDCKLSPRARFDLSPDGKRIAFVGVVRPTYPAGVILADVATGESRAFTRPEPGVGDDLQPRFSTDGKRLSFFRGSESHRQLWVADVSDPATARAASAAEGLTYGSAWMGPDGPIVVAADWFGFRALNLVDVATGEARLLGARGARFPDLAPGGALVYENATYAANLWAFDPRDTVIKPRVLWPSTRYTNQAEYSPDGKRIAFVSNREGVEAIFVAPLDGAPAKLTLPAGFRHIRPHWSADGKALHATRIPIGPLRSRQQAVRIEIATGKYEILEPLGTQVIDVRESRDGQWIYVGESSGSAMRLLRAKASDLHAIERLPVPLVSEYQLSSTRIAFAQPQLRGLTSCRMPELTCQPIDIPIADFNRFAWTLGEKSVYFLQPGDTANSLARFDLRSGIVTRQWDYAPTAFGGSVAVSPAEDSVIVVREEKLLIDLMIAR
ncbi:Tol-Pal system protein TolB [Usitatibacter rugosus]|uniref:Tol-Pal system protein TolB n=1 Tax=Usitatibacter rugosus TaxID=2732067 RepID=A0A6M4GZJ4_9PROT|nr:winged helix-turn-helix domain-containing protein [Usitatibacter rugosus]QJR12661.1 Tol-Pal system protein TolB [Usitatibacter rugosus]